MHHGCLIDLLEAIEQRWIALELFKLKQFVDIFEVLNKSEDRENLVGRREWVPLLFHLVLMNIKYRQIIRYLIFKLRSKLLFNKHILYLFDDDMRLHVQFSDIFFKPLVQWLNPLHGLLVFHFILGIDVFEYLLNQYWIKEALLDILLNVFSLLHKINKLL